MREKLLIIDAETEWATTLKNYLESHNFDVIVGSSAEEGQSIFLAEYPCMIILELALPNMSGENFCSWVRQQHHTDISIIVVSKKHLVKDKIHALTIGADDYLTKPVIMEELLAHIHAVLRRTGLFCQKITYEGLCIMPRKGEVLLHGHNIQLTKHEFMLLYYFMDHPNVVISREELVQHLYPNLEKDILDRTIDAHIKKLRLKIEDNPKKPTRIVTIRGSGYKFTAD